MTKTCQSIRFIFRWIRVAVFPLMIWISGCIAPDPAETERAWQRVQTIRAEPTATPIPPVVNSAWDGSVIQVMHYISTGYTGCKPVKYLEWSPVARLIAGGFAVRARFKVACPGYSAMEMEHVFYLDENGRIMGYDHGGTLMELQEYEAQDIVLPIRQPVRRWTDPEGRIHISN
ncbi:hypothetical protein JXA80_06840 [bacterium]|nr:hypothetical protein [candidate division CSSED10-310 bacterium]